MHSSTDMQVNHQKSEGSKNIQEYDEDLDSHNKIYQKFLKRELPHENARAVCYWLVYGLPLIAACLSMANEISTTPELTLQFVVLDTLKRSLVVLFFEPFLFVVVHVYLHIQMTIGIQSDFIALPHAYYHHYVDSSLYSKLPFMYRFSPIPVIPMASGFAYISGMNYSTFLLIQTFNNFDVLIHEWHHTAEAKYRSLNPFSSKFVPIKWIMKSLSAVGIVDTLAHKLEHHKERIHNIHLSADWIDMKIPVSSWLADYVGIFLFWIQKKLYLELVNGTSHAEPCIKLKNWIQMVLISLPALFVQFILFASVSHITEMSVNAMGCYVWADAGMYMDFRTLQFMTSSLYLLCPYWSFKSNYQRCNSAAVLETQKKINNSLWTE